MDGMLIPRVTKTSVHSGWILLIDALIRGTQKIEYSLESTPSHLYFTVLFVRGYASQFVIPHQDPLHIRYHYHLPCPCRGKCSIPHFELQSSNLLSPL